MARIDTHQHFWRLSRGGYGWMPEDIPALYRDYEPSDLIPQMARSGITGTIAVQADDNVAETEFLLSLCEKHDWIRGVVGWVDLEAPDAPEVIARLAENPRLVGVRPMIQDIEDPEWMMQERLRPGIEALVAHDLTFDALILQVHLPVLARFMERYPELRIVVDHFAKPDMSEARFGDWMSGMIEVAGGRDVFCKLSGLMTEAAEGATAADLTAYFDVAADAFGQDRLLFGSDWPVLNMASTYATWTDIVREYCGRTDGLDWSGILSDNPLRAYPRLKPSS